MENIVVDHYRHKAKQAVSLRVWAALIDYVLLLIVTWLIIRGLGAEVRPGVYQVRGGKALLPILYWFVYFVIGEYIFWGTPGKRLMGLVVLNIDGERADFGQILRRRISDCIDITWCFGILGYLLMRNTVNHQRLGDMWGKTVVLKGKPVSEDFIEN